ncbi:hypothetical protein SAMN05216582_12337 [Selenomonas ruminantium]|uniref:Uncharacterized protein n=1 Tax=Selenomonas ruminantium TaxID=971 RepID=A0A1M6W8Z0_SELRU|nr:hypothetical protein SAMN05216582_12337 [Selenomonas ruminantium]
MTVFLQRIIEIIGAVDIGPGLSPLLIEGVHIAVGTPRTDADTAMPGIPYIMHMHSPQYRSGALFFRMLYVFQQVGQRYSGKISQHMVFYHGQTAAKHPLDIAPHGALGIRVILDME